MKKYIAVVDKKATAKNKGFEFHILDAKNLKEAILEANAYVDDEAYLVDICEKVGKIRRFNRYSEVDYESILRNRGCGWDEPDSYSEVWTMERYTDFETYHLTISR